MTSKVTFNDSNVIFHIMIRKGVRQLDRGLKIKKEMKNPLAKVIARKGILNELTEV